MSQPESKSRLAALGRIRELAKLPDPEPPPNGLYLFFSFDLVDSTAFKLVRPADWPKLVAHFYEVAADYFRKRFDDCVLWKYLGDEVLFYVHLQRVEQIPLLLEAVREAGKLIEEALGEFSAPLHGRIHTKSTIWLADSTYLPPHQLKEARPQSVFRNLIIEPGRVRRDHYDFDFIGPEMDAGFRLGAHVERSRILLSAELALFIATVTSFAELQRQCRIVEFVKLKGVWSDRYYPIVWYEADWERFDETIKYDEPLRSSKVAAILAGNTKALQCIQGVFSDLGQTDLGETLLKKLQPCDDPKTPLRLRMLSKVAEVHCVAVCLNDHSKVLIARRSEKKRRFPGAWEFGCGQLSEGESFGQALERVYQNDFKIEINLPFPDEPIGSYTIEDSAGNTPGIIFAANSSAGDPVVFASSKYSEAKWCDIDEALNFDSADCIPNFHRTLRSGVEKLRQS